MLNGGWSEAGNLREAASMTPWELHTNETVFLRGALVQPWEERTGRKETLA